MKSKSLKKALAAMLALSLVMAPVMGVSAAPGTSGNDATGKVTTTTNSNASTESNTSVSAAEAVVIPATSSVKVGGKVLVTTIKGAYMSKTIPGTVVATDKATLAAGYGLAPGEQPYVRVYDISEAKSPAAMTSINAAAGAVGGTVVATVNVELGKLAGGKFSLLEQGGAPITMAFGIPKNAVKPGYAYAMICVRPVGVIEFLPDLDAGPNTVTFRTTGGLDENAMIMYPVA